MHSIAARRLLPRNGVVWSCVCVEITISSAFCECQTPDCTKTWLVYTGNCFTRF